MFHDFFFFFWMNKWKAKKHVTVWLQLIQQTRDWSIPCHRGRKKNSKEWGRLVTLLLIPMARRGFTILYFLNILSLFLTYPKLLTASFFQKKKKLWICLKEKILSSSFFIPHLFFPDVIKYFLFFLLSIKVFETFVHTSGSSSMV